MAKKADKINKAPSGASFMYVPKPEPGHTLCPRCNKGHVVWTGTATVYHFECGSKRCKWNSKPLRSGGDGTRPKFKLRPLVKFLKRDEHKPLPTTGPRVQAFISETPTTITSQDVHGKVTEWKKVPYAQVVARLKREAKKT
jgi:hypothetical protein